MRILQINAAARSQGANSTAVANRITARLQSLHPNASVTVRDLATQPHPVLDQAALGAMFTPDEARDAAQQARMAQDQVLIDELLAHDLIVFGVPMYNFNISVQFKNWIDAVAKARVTFRYTENGPEGLVKGKKVYCGLARAGVYRDTPDDIQVAYLKKILGFMGMDDVQFIYAEGLAQGNDGIAQAEQQIAALSA